MRDHEEDDILEDYIFPFLPLIITEFLMMATLTYIHEYGHPEFRVVYYIEAIVFFVLMIRLLRKHIPSSE